MAEIRRTISFNAPIGRVWAYITDSEKIARWLMPNDFLPTDGHAFKMDCPPGVGSGAPVTCQIRQIAPPSDGRARLSYTWTIDQPLTETLLTIDLHERDGTTTMDLVHSGWNDMNAAGRALLDRHGDGWTMLLNQALRPLVERELESP